MSSRRRRTRAVRDRKIGVHHSALERNVRHRVEAGLRAGTLRTVVCSTSLELGVDIGYIDRVLLLGGARGMTSTLQRVGRAGHRPGAIATGIVVAQDRDDIIEAAATRRCIADGMIEDVQIPDAPLDVLAQWLVGLAVPDRRVAIADALALARRALSVPRSERGRSARVRRLSRRPRRGSGRSAHAPHRRGRRCVLRSRARRVGGVF